VIAPGKGAEIMTDLAEGKTFVFHWKATGEVDVDMHGETPRAQVDYTSYWIGGALRECAGTLKAAFDGQHGWYWRNRGKRAELTRSLRPESRRSRESWMPWFSALVASMPKQSRFAQRSIGLHSTEERCDVDSPARSARVGRWHREAQGLRQHSSPKMMRLGLVDAMYRGVSSRSKARKASSATEIACASRVDAFSADPE
jgi:hypothetical protein